MLLNTTFCVLSDDHDKMNAFFNGIVFLTYKGNFDKAYATFVFIIRWINWKVNDVNQISEYYYNAFFHDWSKYERRRVIGLIGLDILRYVEDHPQTMNLVDHVYN